MSKKKLIILSMTCNSGFFKAEDTINRRTWAKDVLLDKEDDGCSFYSYIADTAGSPTYIDDEVNLIHCNSGDGLWDTFYKTIEAFKAILSLSEGFDYVFRTNTSTVVNVPLLRQFVDTLKDDETAWCGELYATDIPCPLPFTIYPRGNALLLSRKLVERIVDWSKYVVVPPRMFADDNIIGNVLNTYHMLRFEEYNKYIRSFGQGWYESADQNGKTFTVNHSNGLCEWNNSNISYDFIKNFIAIQVRSYKNRASEFVKIQKISEELNRGNKGRKDFSEEIERIMKYSNNPKLWHAELRNGKAKYVDYKQP